MEWTEQSKCREPGASVQEINHKAGLLLSEIMQMAQRPDKMEVISTGGGGDGFHLKVKC